MRNNFMKDLKDKKIIITGAAGGIGEELVKLLAKEGANLFLLSASQDKLIKLQNEVKALGGLSNYAVVDLSNSQGIKDAAAIISEIDNPDILINLAGISYFGSFGLQKFDEIERLYNVNLLAPTILSQAILPEMVKRNSGQIVNIGSFFGSIAFPYYATYSSSKAGLRSFSESLRREVSKAGIKVSYIVPRAVKTSINDRLATEFLRRTKTAVDEPSLVATRILKAVKAEKKYAYLGFPESFFVRLNYLIPSVVDMALQKQGDIAREILSETN
jgi:short-subunit dehydrogenase